MLDHTEAEELVARALCLAVGDVWFTSETYASSDWDDERDTYRRYARAALAALAEAGLLLPAGGQTRDEWMAEIDRGHGFTPSPGPSAPYICRTESDIDKYVRGIVKLTRKMRRTVHTGPWREVTP